MCAADVLSPYLGVTEQNIVAHFQSALDKAPSILFIDEVDSLARQRTASEDDVARRIKNTFLLQLDSETCLLIFSLLLLRCLFVLNNDNKSGIKTNDVIVIAATNCVEQIDAAVLRRFSKQITVPLPDAAARIAMFRTCLVGTRHSLSDSDLQILANETQSVFSFVKVVICLTAFVSCSDLFRGYSYADIERIIVDALMGVKIVVLYFSAKTDSSSKSQFESCISADIFDSMRRLRWFRARRMTAARSTEHCTPCQCRWLSPGE